MLVALAHAVVLAAAAPAIDAQVAAMTAREKAAAVVISGLPAPRGVGGVIVQRWSRALPRPAGALVYADQEGGGVRAFRELPPFPPAAVWRRTESAYRSARATRRALATVGVDVDLAPVLDTADGPLGSRHFARPDLAVAFARGLGSAACAKHFPGLGSTPRSTDVALVTGVVRPQDLRPFRDAVRAGVRCVMVASAVYPRLGSRRAVFEPATYRLLRSLGFDGVVVTDDLSAVRNRDVGVSARLAVEAGADAVLTTSGRDAARAIRALVPLARRGELDAKVARLLRWRRALSRSRP